VTGVQTCALPIFFKAVGNIFRWRVWGKVMDYCLYRFFGTWREGKVVEIIFLQVGFHG
jgi:hypothetical protein